MTEGLNPKITCEESVHQLEFERAPKLVLPTLPPCPIHGNEPAAKSGIGGCNLCWDRFYIGYERQKQLDQINYAIEAYFYRVFWYRAAATAKEAGPTRYCHTCEQMVPAAVDLEGKQRCVQCRTTNLSVSAPVQESAA